jgi:uncharacterized membrane protein required for colicin V production
MLLDILITGPMLVFTLLGLRDGVIRKLVAIVMFTVGLLLGQLFMKDVGQFLADNGWVRAEDASLDAYVIIFVGIAVLQGLLYKLIAHGYRIGGFLDRVGGLALGFMEGVLFLSCLFFILARTGFPSHDIKRDSMFYKPVVNIAPQILDATSFIDSESAQTMKEVQRERTVRRNERETGVEAVDTAAVMDEARQNELLKNAREANRKKNP